MSIIKKLLFISLVTAIFLSDVHHGKTNQKFGYVTVNKLFIRSKPSLKSEKLGFLIVGDKITIIDKSSDKQVIAGKNNYWYKFKMAEKTGWVFGGFISMNKVNTKDILMSNLKGTYTYYNKPGGSQAGLLIIKGDKYTERWYDNKLGISDEFTGTVIFQAYDIILVPRTRKSRPSVYIDNPNKDEKSIYAYAYRMHDNDPARLHKIKRLKVNAGYKKLMIMKRDKNIFLVSPKRKKEIEKKNITQAAKMYPAYKHY